MRPRRESDKADTKDTREKNNEQDERRVKGNSINDLLVFFH